MKILRSSMMTYVMGALIMLAVIWVPIQGIRTTAASALLIGRTHEVRKELEDVVSAEHEILFQHRNYMLSSNPVYLERMREDIKQRRLELDQVRILLQDNPDQIARLEILDREIERLNANLEKEAADNSTRDLLTEELKRIPRNEALLRRIQMLASEIDSHEDQLMRSRTKVLQREMLVESLLTILVGGLSAIFLLHLLVRFKRDLKQRAAMELALRQTHAAAESANKAKSAFLANMSHEIRTPLAAILGFTELLGDPNLPEEKRRKFLETVNRNGRVLGTIIDDILDLSKVEAGKLAIEKLDVDLRRLIADVMELLGQRANDKGIELRLNLAENVPKMISSDPVRLRQILFNMLGNAIKFTDQGSVCLSVRWSLYKDRKTTGRLDLEVTDTGRGIAEHQREALFKPFSQADTSTSRKFGGTGLGLVLSRNLARALGGDLVLVDSTCGQGSVFLASIETTDVGMGLTATAMSSVSAIKLQGASVWQAPILRQRSNSNVEEQLLSGRRILVADDSPDNLLLMSVFLKTAGATVDVVNNGAQAVEQVLQHHYDAVLMDIQMPEMDGYAATAMLRRKGYEGVIIALTAHAMAEERERSRQSGFDGHIAKPVGRDMLNQEVAKIISSRGSIQLDEVINTNAFQKHTVMADNQ